ncbi:hypothetical protein ACFQY3_15205 [Paenibacillus farraposensis]|uniref:hypothetical protein n=1 Tax=Paenibacillus farraposensis TaxID=2807095 RepID=UPI00360958ED
MMGSDINSVFPMKNIRAFLKSWGLYPGGGAIIATNAVVTKDVPSYSIPVLKSFKGTSQHIIKTVLNDWVRYFKKPSQV